MIEVVINIAPLKTVRTKNTSNEWFDREIAEKLSLRDKLFKKFESGCLNIENRRKNGIILRRNYQKI